MAPLILTVLNVNFSTPDDDSYQGQSLIRMYLDYSTPKCNPHQGLLGIRGNIPMILLQSLLKDGFGCSLPLEQRSKACRVRVSLGFRV